MKYAVVVGLFVCATASASEPGQPFDCQDVVLMEPGLACVEVTDPHSERWGLNIAFSAASLFDNEGRLLYTDGETLGYCGGNPVSRTTIESYSNGAHHRVLYLD